MAMVKTNSARDLTVVYLKDEYIKRTRIHDILCLPKVFINILLLVAILIFPAKIIQAQENPIEIIYSGNSLIDANPKTIITTAFMVNNKGSESLSVQSELRLPNNWALITGETSFELGPEASDIQLISFHVSQSALAGKYEIVYTVRDTKDYSNSASYIINVNVLPITKISIKFVEAPEYVIAGEMYRANFTIINEGNILVTLDVNAVSAYDYPFRIDTSSIRLSPNESKLVRVLVNTDREAKATIRHQVVVKANIAWNKLYEVSASSSVNVISRTPQAGDLFIRYPVVMTNSGFFGTTETTSNYASAYQTELYGDGSIDRDNKKQLGFIVRVPDTRKDRGYGTYDEYALNFRTDSYKIALGDENLTLSDLTGRSSYGRGINGNLSLGDFSLMAYHQKSRWASSDKSWTAGQINYIFSQNSNVNLNFLRNRGQNDSGITSLASQISPGFNTIINAECSVGKKKDIYNYAYLLKVYGQQKRFQYNLSYLHAEPDYSGYYKDIDSIHLRSLIRLASKFDVSGGFSQMKSNINLNPKSYSADMNRIYSAGLMYQPFNILGFRIGYTYDGNKDMFPEMKFDYFTHKIDASTNHNIGDLTITTSFEHKKSINRLESKYYKSTDYGISSYYTLSGKFVINLNVNYQNDVDSDNNIFSKLQTYLSNTIYLSKKIPINIYLYNYHYLKEGFEDQTSLFGEIEYLMSENHRFILQSQNTFRKNMYSNDVILSYIAKIGIPIHKKKNIGKAKGRIYYDLTKKAIPNAIITLEGVPSISNDKGEFEFPVISTGVYNLNVNTQRIGPNLIFSKDTPEKVLIAEGKESIINIGLTTGCSVSGRIIVYTFAEKKEGIDNQNQEETLEEAYGLSNAILEISDGEKKKLHFTDGNGYFIFDGLHPGKWTLKLISYDVPDFYYVEEDTFDIFLFPNDKAKKEFKILPKKRIIRIIDEGEIIEEQEISK